MLPEMVGYPRARGTHKSLDGANSTRLHFFASPQPVTYVCNEEDFPMRINITSQFAMFCWSAARGGAASYLSSLHKHQH
jgi:hypothetical protein